jgi:hypothetical protein
MLWQTEHDFRKMAAPRSLDACVEALWELLAKDEAKMMADETKKAMKSQSRALCLMRKFL